MATIFMKANSLVKNETVCTFMESFVSEKTAQRKVEGYNQSRTIEDLSKGISYDYHRNDYTEEEFYQ